MTLKVVVCFFVVAFFGIEIWSDVFRNLVMNFWPSVTQGDTYMYTYG